MFEDLERQVNDEAARQRATKAKVMFDIGPGALQQGKATPWEPQNGFLTGINSILAAFSKRES
jgi:hypothetical protein